MKQTKNLSPEKQIERLQRQIIKFGDPENKKQAIINQIIIENQRGVK